MLRLVNYQRVYLTQCSMEDGITTTRVRIGMLRQWLNEDRIVNPKMMITNEDIIFWLTGEKKDD